MLRNILILIIVLAALAVAMIFAPWMQPLHQTSFESIDPALLSAVPDAATEIYVVPRFASFWRAARQNRVAGGALIDLMDQASLAPLVIGNSPVVYWRTDEESAVLTRLGPVRHFLASRYLGAAGRFDVYAKDEILSSGTIGASVRAFDASTIRTMGEGHAFIIYPEEKPTFPPVGRPMLAALKLEQDGVKIRAAGRRDGAPALTAPRFALPVDAPMIATTGAPPEWLSDLDKVLGVEASAALRQGFGVALYDVETGALSIRPKVVLVLPGDAAPLVRSLRGLSGSAARVLGGELSEQKRMVSGVEVTRTDDGVLSIESAFWQGQTVVALDGESLSKFLVAKTIAVGGDSAWTIRADPERLAPILERLREHRVLRFVARDLQRNVSSFARSIGRFQGSRSVEMKLVAEGEFDSMTVVVMPKQAEIARK